jgi:hypothetical protein
MLASVAHVLPLTTIKRERFLQVPGRLAVRQGQKVNPTDVIAEAEAGPQHIMLDVARGLKLSRTEADTHIQRKAGDHLSEGDLIAGPVGFPKRVIRAPRAGKVVITGNGQVFMEVENPPLVIQAGIPGMVISLIPEHGATIETTGALIQGIWGNGLIDFGLMHVLAHKPEEILTSNQLDVSLRGSVILAGYCEDPEVLTSAEDLPVHGLILASMTSSLIPIALKLSFPVLVIEGFGLLPMNTVAYNLLSANDRNEVAINAEPLDIYKNTRPEIVIPMPSDEKPPMPNETVMFSPKQRVRIVRAPYKSQIGEVVTLRTGLEVFPTKLRSPAAEVRLENDEKVMIPLANLEVIE